MAGETGFGAATFDFLAELADNNNRDWFEARRDDYERLVRTPALDFISAMQAPMAAISDEFPALARKVGGSLMRVHRDVRFSRDKQPYKTNIGIQFRHRLGKDVHAPGFYVHISAEECFLGAGIWHPDSRALNRLRVFLDDNPGGWRQAVSTAGRHGFELQGDSLKRPPRGYEDSHPLIEDLKRKDFIAVAPLRPEQVTGPAFVAQVAEQFRATAPLVRYLCTALELPY